MIGVRSLNVADAGGATLVHDVVDVLVSEVFQCAEDRVRRGHTETAEACFFDGGAKIDEQVKVGHGAFSRADAGKDVEHLRGTGAAGNAFAAGLGHAELDEEAGDVDHAGGIVHDDHAAGAHHGADFDEGVVADADVEQFSGEATAGGAAGLHGLEGVAVGYTAANAFNDVAELDAHGDFDEAGVGDFAGEGEDLGALAAFRAHAREPRAAFADDGRDIGEGFNVVDEGGLAPESADRGIGRTGLWLAAAAFNGGDESSLLAANEGTGAETNLHIEVEGRVADIVAEQAAATGIAQASR